MYSIKLTDYNEEYSKILFKGCFVHFKMILTKIISNETIKKQLRNN